MFSLATILDTAVWIEILREASFKGLVILVAAGVCMPALRRASASTRHLIWSFTLGGVVALPVLSLLLPVWHIPVLSDGLATLNVFPAAEMSYRAEIGASHATTPSPGTALERQAPPAQSTLADVIPPTGSVTPERAPVSWSWTTWVFIIWMTGFAVVLSRFGIGLVRIWRITHRAWPITDSAWMALSQRYSTQFGLTRHAPLFISDDATVPLTWGMTRPVVLLPSGATDWPVDRRHIVLVHELAHIKRRDCLTQLLAQIACAVYWFNPLVWFAARQHRVERERACDDQVLDTGAKASQYADHLLDMARAFRAAQFGSFATVAFARRTQLEGRLLAILDPHISRKGVDRLAALLVGFAVACAIVPLATLQPSAQPSQKAQITSNDNQMALSVREEPVVSSNPSPTEISEASATDRAEPVAPPASASPHLAIETTGNTTVALALSDQQDLDPIVQQMKNLDPDVRYKLVEVIGKIGGPQAVVALIKALKDDHHKVRREAADELGQIGDPSAIPALIEALKDESREVRREAADALGQIGGTAAVPGLIEALKDESREVRREAADGLGQIRDSRAVDGLIEALKDESREVRREAADGLGQIQDSRAVPALIEALKDESREVRREAADGLGQIQDSRAVPALIEALKDESSEVRREAADALGQIGDSRAVDGLIEALKDESSEVGK